jgi:hypothetical protein
MIVEQIDLLLGGQCFYRHSKFVVDVIKYSKSLTTFNLNISCAELTTGDKIH